MAIAAALFVFGVTARASAGDGSNTGSISVTGLTSLAQRTDTLGLGREPHSAALAAELRRSGFSAVDANGGGEKAPSATLGGTITEVHCEAEAELRCNIAIRWELSDKRSREILYRVVTRARASGSDGAELAPALLTSALRSLAARPKFRAAVQQSETNGAVVGVDSTFRECPASRISMPEASQVVLASTVLIESGKNLGSGSIVSPDGFVLTAAHVLEPGAPLHVQLASGPVMDAYLVRRDLGADVALLRIKGGPFNQCLAERQETIDVGEEVYAIGSPLSKELSFSLTRGIVSGFRTVDGVPLVQTDASVNPGNSGGPLVDKRGRLIAVVDFKITHRAVQGLAFAVTAQAAMEALHIRGGSSSDAALSVPLEARITKQPTAVDDTDDPAQAGDVPETVHGPKSGAPATLRAIGGVTASLGLIGVGTSWLAYEASKDSMKRSDFNTYLTINSVSWAAVGLGVGTFTFSYLLGDGSGGKRRHTNKRTSRVYGVLGPASIVIGGDL